MLASGACVFRLRCDCLPSGPACEKPAVQGEGRARHAARVLWEVWRAVGGRRACLKRAHLVHRGSSKIETTPASASTFFRGICVMNT